MEVGVIGLGLGEGRTAFHFIELDVFALFFVAVSDDRGDAAAGLGSISRIIPFSVNSIDMVGPTSLCPCCAIVNLYRCR